MGCIALVLGAALVGCNTSNDDAGAGTASEVNEPTVVNLYPIGSASEAIRLFIPIVAVGDSPLSQVATVGFDTGSAGLTLYAPDAFPATIVTACTSAGESPCGFIFPAGQHSLTYKGITITDLQGYRCYGGNLGRTEVGNVGYAQVTFGDPSKSLTTTQMPIFFYYKTTKNVSACNDGAVVDPTPESAQGWFGVNTAADSVSVANTPSGQELALCSIDSTGTCALVSVLKYLRYGPSINAGFALSPPSPDSCTFTTGNCPAEPMLTIGVTAAMQESFATVTLSCVANQLNDGFPVCNANAPKISAVVTPPGQGGTPVTLPASSVLFDTGTPTMLIVGSAAAISTLPTQETTSQPPATIVSPEATVTFTTPVGVTYSYQTVASGPTETIVNPGGIGQNIIGVEYFQSNSLLIDLTSGVEGWMANGG